MHIGGPGTRAVPAHLGTLPQRRHSLWWGLVSQSLKGLCVEVQKWVAGPWGQALRCFSVASGPIVGRRICSVVVAKV